MTLGMASTGIMMGAEICWPCCCCCCCTVLPILDLPGGAGAPFVAAEAAAVEDEPEEVESAPEAKVTLLPEDVDEGGA